MKIILLIIVCCFLQLALLAQDKRYTLDSENGFMWIDFDKRMIAKNVKYDFLSSMLENIRLKKLAGNYNPVFNCDLEVSVLQSKSIEIDLNVIIKMIDYFYSNEDNLIIPINFAYCYCIKKLAGNTDADLNTYRKKLLEFCNSGLKK